jgi:hypothetical protein
MPEPQLATGAAAVNASLSSDYHHDWDIYGASGFGMKM